ncbi:MAG: general secretion pathway protein GspB [Massilia sp.]|nr:general secretion pathway protein GspB [Massilia sp.]
MSYILEALKKAQAERQLGNAPTIHAIPIQAAPLAGAVSPRLPVYAALAISAALLAGTGVYWWRQPQAAAPAVLVVQPTAPAAAPVVALAPLAPPVTTAPLASPPPVVAAMPAPAPGMTMPAAPKLRAAPPAKAAPIAPAPSAAEPLAQARVAPPAPTPTPAPAAEENLPYMRDLPESQRSSLPQVSFGGYMYSKNPADRLLLIDKVLRHEGEEVAPGLVLQKLLPRAAVMNYRGTRYRVAY